MEYGTAEHAADVTQGRHPGIRDGLQWLTYAHLPQQLQKFSSVFYEAAVELLTRITSDSPELATALNKIIEAKDSAMRAGIRMDTGRAGSVPRPQEVVDPPKLDGPTGGTPFPQRPGEPYGDYLQRAQRHLDEQHKPIHHYDDPEA